ncbi:hypothetical protein BaRGS_00020169 [Batillaria attramentaria]|uniref:CCHC-type domain-containing protein n=1 Tax=Batillaria attramentaria TaxID=370345 RepID=A0ABD0KMZ9_9CAEN
MPSFKPPAEFNFDRPAEWPSWKQRFDRYRSASQLYGKPGEDQVSALIYSMGEKAERIFEHLTFPAATQAIPDPKKDYETVCRLLTDHFLPRRIRNLIHERAKFNTRVQQEGESIEQYVHALLDLSQFCDFTDKDERIRDRMVAGVRDGELAQRLQLEITAATPLQDAIDSARHFELVKNQVSTKSQTVEVDAVRGRRPRGGSNSRRPARGSGSRGRGRYENRGYDNHADCGRCGRNHQKGNCPATGKKCLECGKIGHFRAVCRSRNNVNNVAHVAEEEPRYFIGSTVTEMSEPPWLKRFEMEGARTQVTFKIDTGADVNVLFSLS